MSEVRYVDSEVRLFGDDGKTIEGFAALYNKRSIDMGFYETIMPGAFSDADMSDVRMLWNHNGDIVLARTRSGTLSVSADAQGLRYNGVVADTTWGRDALISVARGDVDQSSFAFDLKWGHDDEWEVDESGKMHRKINRFRRVTDVSPTAFPAYEQTRINTRSFDDKQLAEIRSMLQKSKTDAARIDLMVKIHKILNNS